MKLSLRRLAAYGRLVHSGRWYRWYAWYPVITDDLCLAWFCWVQRRRFPVSEVDFAGEGSITQWHSHFRVQRGCCT